MANDRHINAGVGDVTVDEFAFLGFASGPEVPPVPCTFFALHSLCCSERWVGVPSLRSPYYYFFFVCAFAALGAWRCWLIVAHFVGWVCDLRIVRHSCRLRVTVLHERPRKTRECINGPNYGGIVYEKYIGNVYEE